MNQALPVTVYKSWVGALGIFLAGLVSLVFVTIAFGASAASPWADPFVMYGIAALVIFVIVAATSVSLRVYSLSYFTLSDAGVTVVQWNSLFNSQKVMTEWSDIQDVSATTSGVFGQLLNFGTVSVQTSGTKQNLKLTFTPDPQKWQGVIEYYQDKSTPNVPLSTGA